MTVELSVEDRQAIIIALAHLANDWPDADAYLWELGKKMGDEVDDVPRLFDKLKRDDSFMRQRIASAKHQT